MGADPFTAAMFAGNTGLGAIQANQAKQAQKGQYKTMNRLFDTLDPQVQRLFANALQTSNAGFDSAMRTLSGAGATAKSNAAMSAKQALGMGTDNAIGRGLYGTSYLDSMRRGVSSDLTRTNAQIDEQTASLLSSLMTQKAGAAAGLMTGQAGLLSNIAGTHAGAIGGYSFQPMQAPDLMGFAKLFGGNGGAAWGSGGGGVSGMPSWMQP